MRLYLYGDVPLSEAQKRIRLLIEGHQDNEISLLTAILPDADGYGRIIRDDGNVHSYY